MHFRRIGLALLLLGATACDETPVSLPEAAGVTVAAGTMALAVGDAAPVAAQVVDQDGRVMQGQAVVYSTDNASVATVGTDGMVRGVGPGTASVSATHGGSAATVKVTVTAPALQVKVPNATMGLVVGEAAPAGAQVLGAHGQVVQGAVPVFSSDNPSVATVGTDGVIRGVSPGTATVSAAHGGSAATVKVTVTAPPAVQVTVANAAMELVVGETAPAGAQVMDASGRVVQGAVPVFSSGNPAVATVGTDGVVRGVTPGTATIRASYGASSATVQVTVAADRRNELQSLQVMADSVVTDWRAGVQAVAVRAVNGFGQTVCPTLTLRTSDRAVATARTAGPCRIEVVPNFTGEAVITAEADGRTDTFRVRITSNGQIAFISARPTSAQLVAGATVSYTVKVLDQASRPIANQRVSFEASVGTVSANSVVTGEDGTATVQWQIPTDLRNLGQNHWFAYRALLPNGVLVAREETVFINGASLAEIVLYRGSPGAFTRLNSAAITVPGWSSVYLGASGLDQYGNVRTANFTFALTGTHYGWSCGGSDGTRDAFGVEYTCFYGPSGATTTLTATAPDGQQKSVKVIFN
jgi:uncharacterized protein YjdB